MALRDEQGKLTTPNRYAKMLLENAVRDCVHYDCGSMTEKQKEDVGRFIVVCGNRVLSSLGVPRTDWLKEEDLKPFTL